MTQDEIIEMARQAGFDCYGKHITWDDVICTDELKAFAKLVAAKEREACAKVSHPPQRTWVGLTTEETLDMFDLNNVYGSKWIEFARTVEAKLKEKNT
jgi:hypothetical protein